MCSYIKCDDTNCLSGLAPEAKHVQKNVGHTLLYFAL